MALSAVWAVCFLLLLVPAHVHGSVVQTWAPRGHARGVVLLLHGGGWLAGPGYPQSVAYIGARLKRQGYRVANLKFRAGYRGYRDILRDVDRYGARKVCLFGDSSGGHWALMVAHTRPVSCVIARSAPSDLSLIGTDGNPALQQAVPRLFPASSGNWNRWSPATFHAWNPVTQYYLTSSPCDAVVPDEQTSRMLSTLRAAGVSVTRHRLPCASYTDTTAKTIVHVKVSGAIYRRESHDEARFLDRVFAHRPAVG